MRTNNFFVLFCFFLFPSREYFLDLKKSSDTIKIYKISVKLFDNKKSMDRIGLQIQ